MPFGLYDELCEIPLFDNHTHVDSRHMTARGLHDILLYHMVISELYSAGCPSGARLSEDPGVEEIEARITEAIPYIPHIAGTSCYWGVRIILSGLYDWHEPITLQNWRELHSRIALRSYEQTWGREILRKCNVESLCTELWRGSRDCGDIFYYCLEWAFFARSQWGQFDVALLELENAWNQNEPGAPLPVNISFPLNFERTVQSSGDVRRAIKHYCDKIPAGKALSTAQHISTDIRFTDVDDAMMDSAINRRASAGPAERDIYSSYILAQFLSELEKRESSLVFQFSLGGEPLPYETMSRLRSDTMRDLAGIIQAHPGVRFQCFLSSTHQNQALCSLARESPNLSVAGYWWHSFFPSHIRAMMEQRFDMLPANRHVAFFSDAYCIDWIYAKSHIVRKQMARVLGGMIEEGRLDRQAALDTARAVLYDTPRSILGIGGGLQ